jgi:hypothetical protein
MLLAEYALRNLQQREEALNHRLIALQKAKAIESDNSELEKANELLEETRAQIPRKEYDLYRAVYMMPYFLQKDYQLLRENEAWFMRKEMVQDCSDRGGCCSRGCGCCSQRHISKGKKGNGHCTTECWCCTVFRGFELSQDDKEAINKYLRIRLEHKKSPYLINIANSFFRFLPKPPPETPETPTVAAMTSNPKSRWQEIFGRNK